MIDGQLFTWVSAARSHVGCRRQLNEDAWLERGAQGIWAVADGMGGHSAGDVASRMVIEALHDVAPAGNLLDLAKSVGSHLESVNLKLAQEASRRGQQLIGSTVAVLLVFERNCIVLWAGDSRVYLLRENRLQQLTRDHTQIEDMIAKGLISRDEAASRRGNHAITRAVGVMESLELDSKVHDVQVDDIFLLCTDGLYNEVNRDDIQRILASGDCRLAADRLVEKALEQGARDNVSVVVVRAGDSQITETVFNPSASQPDAQDDDDKTKINR